MGLVYERNLPHQEAAIKAVLEAFEGASLKQTNLGILQDSRINPILELDLRQKELNLRHLQERQGLEKSVILNSNVYDLMMETGTGKTYTYTKLAFELYQKYKLRKFVIAVPSLAIKANTMNFLQSDSTREHFRSEYGFELEAFMIEAKKDSNKNPTPSALRAFVENESKNELCFLVINSAMLSSDSLKKGYDDNLFDEFDNAFDALSALNVVCIVDEPHLFRKTNEAWKRIQSPTNKQDFATKIEEKAINPQLIFRFGASFYDEGKHSKKGLEFQGKYENLLYVLNAIDAFNQNLIKGIEISICKSEGNERQEYVELLEVDEKSVQARFALKVKGQKNPLKEVTLGLDESYFEAKRVRGKRRRDAGKRRLCFYFVLRVLQLQA